MTFIAAEIVEFVEGWVSGTQPGFINLDQVGHIEKRDGGKRLACYSTDGRLIGYITAAAFTKARKGAA